MSTTESLKVKKEYAPFVETKWTNHVLTIVTELELYVAYCVTHAM